MKTLPCLESEPTPHLSLASASCKVCCIEQISWLGGYPTQILQKSEKCLLSFTVLSYCSGEIPDEKKEQKKLNQRKIGNILQTTAPQCNLWSLKVKKAINKLSETPCNKVPVTYLHKI